MYCIKCGVELADTESKCPLCETTVYHPEIMRENKRPLYPIEKMPTNHIARAVIAGAVIILFLIPLAICFFADFLYNSKMDWFGYVAFGLILAYIVIGLPVWFEKPNPVIFTPCDFAAIILYLLYIDFATDGGWFLSFAFPVVGGIAVITCSIIVLLRYIQHGKLYIFGGAFALFGLLMLLTEYLISLTFCLKFVGWSMYPFVVLLLLGGLLIYLAINKSALDAVRQKLFF